MGAMWPRATEPRGHQSGEGPGAAGGRPPWRPACGAPGTERALSEAASSCAQPQEASPRLCPRVQSWAHAARPARPPGTRLQAWTFLVQGPEPTPTCAPFESLRL